MFETIGVWTRLLETLEYFLVYYDGHQLVVRKTLSLEFPHVEKVFHQPSVPTLVNRQQQQPLLFFSVLGLQTESYNIDINVDVSCLNTIFHTL